MLMYLRLSLLRGVSRMVAAKPEDITHILRIIAPNMLVVIWRNYAAKFCPAEKGLVLFNDSRGR